MVCLRACALYFFAFNSCIIIAETLVGEDVRAVNHSGAHYIAWHRTMDANYETKWWTEYNDQFVRRVTSLKYACPEKSNLQHTHCLVYIRKDKVSELKAIVEGDINPEVLQYVLED